MNLVHKNRNIQMKGKYLFSRFFLLMNTHLFYTVNLITTTTASNLTYEEIIKVKVSKVEDQVYEIILK